mgnify:CR=1 FL=1
MNTEAAMATDAATQELLDKAPPEIRQLAEALRKLVKDVAPEAEAPIEMRRATEAEERGIKGWKAISYSRDGMVCGIQPQRNWVNLIFYRGVELPDPEGVLDGAGKGIRAVKVKKPDDIRGDTLTPLVKAAFRLRGTKARA